MCQLDTHVVLDKGMKNIYVTTANEYIDLDYNDLSVEAYMNPKANPRPKPGVQRAQDSG